MHEAKTFLNGTLISKNLKNGSKMLNVVLWVSEKNREVIIKCKLYLLKSTTEKKHETY